MSKKNFEGLTPDQNSEALEPTKPVRVRKVKKVEEFQPDELVLQPDSEIDLEGNEPAVKPKRRKWVLLGIGGMLLITAIGAAIGYGAAMKVRKIADATQRQLSAATHYELGLLDIQEGRFATAQKRFTYILTIYPQYPGIEEKLKEIMLLNAQNQAGVGSAPPLAGETPQEGIVVVPTKDTRSLNTLYQQAQAQLAAQDWQGLFSTVYQLRDIDPTYQAIKVDGMYFIALRQMGIYEIQAGNLEVGLYDFALAEQLAPIDAGGGSSAETYRLMAMDYLVAGSYWSINWPEAINRFASLRERVPNLRDSSGFTVTQRYANANAGYGRSLQLSYEYCLAQSYFETAVAIYSTAELQEELAQAIKLCQKPPPTPTPTIDPFGPTPTPTKKPRNN